MLAAAGPRLAPDVCEDLCVSERVLQGSYIFLGNEYRQLLVEKGMLSGLAICDHVESNEFSAGRNQPLGFSVPGPLPFLWCTRAFRIAAQR